MKTLCFTHRTLAAWKNCGRGVTIPRLWLKQAHVRMYRRQANMYRKQANVSE